MNIVCIVLLAYLICIIICMNINKSSFYNANELIFENCKKIYRFFQTDRKPQNIRFPINVSPPEAQEFCRIINNLVESSSFVKMNCDDNIIYLSYRILGIKDKFRQNEQIAKAIIENEFSSYIKKVNTLNFLPLVRCDSFIENQLRIRLAISTKGEAIINDTLKGEIP